MKKIFIISSIFFAVTNLQAMTTERVYIEAVKNNDINTANKMLRAGVNVNLKDNHKNTAYCYAYANQNKDMAMFLVDNGAKSNVKCNINGFKFKTETIQLDAATGSASLGTASSWNFRFPSLAPLKPYAIWGLAGVGVAAAAGGGGGGGSDSSSGNTGNSDIDTSAFETAEFYGNAASVGLSELSDSEYLDIINAQYAYARGYDGSGQLVAVLDTGIDRDNDEFDGQIYSDLTNTDFQSGDNDPSHEAGQNDHGTLVASTIVAKKDDGVVHGVAYNAKVIPYRIGAGTDNINGGFGDDAINDAISKGANIFNLSYGSDATASTNATTATRDDLEGYFTGFNNNNDAINTTYMDTFISNVTNNNGIIVMAAGNEGYSQPTVQNALPLHYTEFNDHFVSVVALNSAGTSLASYSNSCGVAKDYCVAAPGSYIILTNNTNSYELNSGTSFAAPTVAGSIALIQDAFGLSSDKTLNILFSTATDMGSAGVDDVYGHGLINLDKATKPGAELNALNSVSSVSFNNTSVNQSSVMSNLQVPTFIIEDELYRTFKVNANGVIVNNTEKVELDKRAKTFAKEKTIIKQKLDDNVSFAFVANNSGYITEDMDYISFTSKYNNTDIAFGFTNSPGQTESEMLQSVNLIDDKAISNPYLALTDNGFNASTSYSLSDNLTFKTNVLVANIKDDDEDSLGKANAALLELGYKLSDKSSIALQSGMINEKSTVLGSKFSGALALSNNSYTYFSGLTGQANINEKINLFANAYMGVTKAGTTQNSLISDVSDIMSYSFALGAEYNIDETSKTGFVISKPLSINKGSLSYNYVSGGNVDKGYDYATEKSSLKAQAEQLDLQAFYKTDLKYNAKLSTCLMHSFNADNIAGQQDSALLVKYGFDF